MNLSQNLNESEMSFIKSLEYIPHTFQELKKRGCKMTSRNTLTTMLSKFECLGFLIYEENARYGLIGTAKGSIAEKIMEGSK